VAATDFVDVTEVAGEPISSEQLARLWHRYLWALEYCREREIVEAACGTGPGLGLLAEAGRSVVAGDVSAAMVQIAQEQYAGRIPVERFDAEALPFASNSKDVVILFEALYYLPHPDRFVAECKRVLRPGGMVLVATANADLPDFNPSPHSNQYFGAAQLDAWLRAAGFSVNLFGYMPIDSLSLRQRVLRPIKRAAVSLGLMPRTMRGKRLLKRLVFGSPVKMPSELTGTRPSYAPPLRLRAGERDTRHKVIYAVARLPADG
jgi:SAM-dependent methyltransferase